MRYSTFRKARDHRAGRAVSFACRPHLAKIGRASGHFVSMVDRFLQPGPDEVLEQIVELAPAYIVAKVAEEFRYKTTVPNPVWQTGFPHLKVIGWGWFHLLTILGDDAWLMSLGWKLCGSMKAGDV